MDATSKESKGFYKLSWLQRIGFGSGDFAQNLIYQTVMQYISIFYTTVFGLNPLIVGVVMLVATLLNLVWSLVLGTYVDKHTSKLGKYRSYLIIGGIPLTIFAILCFWNGFPGSTPYAFVTYIGLSLLYTVVNVPYGALHASLTRDTDEITKLTSTRMFLANLGGFAVAFFIPSIVQSLSPDGKYNTPVAAHAWFITMSIYALVGLVLLIFCFSQCRERVVMEADKTAEVKISDLWMEFVRNRPLRVVAFFIFTAFTLMAIGNAAGPYYISYNIDTARFQSFLQGLSDFIYAKTHLTISPTGVFQGLGSIPAFIFLPMVPAIKKAIGKKQMFYVFLSIAIFGMALLYVISVIPSLRSQIWLLLVAQFIKSTGIIIATGYMWALVPEVISFGEHTTGRRISGMVNAIIGIVFQAGMAVGLFIPNAILYFVGFNKDAVEQSTLTQQGILWLVAVLPALFLVLEMFIISKYELEDHVIDKINREIEEKHLK